MCASLRGTTVARNRSSVFHKKLQQERDGCSKSKLLRVPDGPKEERKGKGVDKLENDPCFRSFGRNGEGGSSGALPPVPKSTLQGHLKGDGPFLNPYKRGLLLIGRQQDFVYMCPT